MCDGWGANDDNEEPEEDEANDDDADPEEDDASNDGVDTGLNASEAVACGSTDDAGIADEAGITELDELGVADDADNIKLGGVVGMELEALLVSKA